MQIGSKSAEPVDRRACDDDAWLGAAWSWRRRRLLTGLPRNLYIHLICGRIHKHTISHVLRRPWFVGSRYLGDREYCPDMTAPASSSQKGHVHLQLPSQQPHGLSRPWKRVLVTGGLILGSFLTILTLSAGHHGRNIHRLQDLWRHPSELSWADLGLGSSMRHYASFDLQSPVPQFLQSDARCEPGYVFFTPGGHSPMILDSKGDLVWTIESSAATQNFRVQRYRQQDYLTYWAGKPFGPGYYYMVRDWLFS